VYYTTGTPYYQPIILTSGGTIHEDLTKVIIVAEVEVGKGPPPTKESIVVWQPGEEAMAFTQLSSGIVGQKISQPNPPKEMFIHWLVK
jgi:hypothetical protein